MMSQWYDERLEQYVDFEAPSPTVEVTDPEVVAVLLGPDGEPLLIMVDRPPFGFQRGS